MANITIIGGGVSGVFLSIQLMRSGTEIPLSITLIEKEKAPWLGVAYSTDKPFHLLNVKVEKMSAIPGEDDHFLNWLNEHNYKLGANDFAQRFVFRKYVEDVFERTMANKQENIDFKFLHDEVVNIEPVNEHKALVHLGSEKTIAANLIVLALGNFTSNSSLTENPALYANEAYYDNPWTRNVLDNLKKDADVLILGTGPTMIDTALTLYSQKHRGKIIALSRHGLIPATHAITEVYPDFSNELNDASSLAELVKIVRKHIAIAEKNSGGWRAVIDALRPYTQKLWLNLSVREKMDFWKYYKTYWEVSRSRMPEECATVIQEMIDSDSLQVTAARIRAFEKQDPRITVRYTNIKSGETSGVTADAVINCMGTGLNFEKIKDPLIDSLRTQGLICNSEAAFGLNAQADGTIIRKDGTPSKMMYTMGPLLRGVLWETIAIPEIRMQAKELATLILQKGTYINSKRL